MDNVWTPNYFLNFSVQNPFWPKLVKTGFMLTATKRIITKTLDTIQTLLFSFCKWRNWASEKQSRHWVNQWQPIFLIYLFLICTSNLSLFRSSCGTPFLAFFPKHRSRNRFVEADWFRFQTWFSFFLTVWPWNDLLTEYSEQVSSWVCASVFSSEKNGLIIVSTSCCEEYMY